MLWSFNQHNFAGGRLDKELMGRQDLTQYYKGCSELKNFTVTRQGNLFKRRGTDYVCTISTSESYSCRLVPLVYDRDIGYYLLLNAGKAYLVCHDGVLTTSKTWARTMESAYYIYSGISDDNLENFDYVQSGDTIFFASRAFKPFKIVFYQSSLTLVREDINFDTTSHTPPTITKTAQTGFTGKTGSKTVKYKVSYVGADGLESDMSEAKSVTYKLPWPEGATITLTISDSNNATRAEYYNVYKDQGGGFGYIGKVDSSEMSGSSNVGTFTDTYISPDMSVTPVSDRKTFTEQGDWPAIVALYQQRLVLGSSANDPFTFWMSCTGDLYNFSTHDTVRDDDAITATLAATEMPEIRHALLGRELMLFTDSGEWEISPVSGNAMTPKTVSAKMQSSIGVTKGVKPMFVGDDILFVDASAQRVLSTRYNYASDGYESQDLTVLSQWLFRNNEIVRAAYRKNPDSQVYCVLSDGSIAVLSYMREHEVCAWSRYTLGGGWKAKDVATSKCDYGCGTEIAYIVLSNSRFTKEIWMERDLAQPGKSNITDDFICLDGERRAIAGETVPTLAVAVGLNTGDVVEAGGTTTETSTLGYAYQAKFESVYPDTKNDGGESMQMEIQNATETKIRVTDSSTFKVGPSSRPESEAVTVDIEPKITKGAITLYDKDARVRLVGDNAKAGKVRIVSDNVWPLNILSVSTTYQVEAANQNGSGGGNG